MEGIAVSVGELKMRAEHERAVRAPLNADVFTETLAQEVPECVGV